jgi:outer membrane protein assembly factor BamE (lipoprotein component of BamABCDE complex)
VGRLAKSRPVKTLVVATTVLYSACSGFEQSRQAFENVKVGMTEAQVIELHGQPLRSYTNSDAPVDYYVKGYSYKERAITNRVLTYVKVEPICYVYIDPQGIVEDVYIGGS